MIRLLASFDESRPAFRTKFQAILDNRQRVRFVFLEARPCLFDAQNFSTVKQSLIALLGNEQKRFLKPKFLRERHIKRDENLFSLPTIGGESRGEGALLLRHLLPNCLRRI